MNIVLRIMRYAYLSGRVGVLQKIKKREKLPYPIAINEATPHLFRLGGCLESRLPITDWCGGRDVGTLVMQERVCMAETKMG